MPDARCTRGLVCKVAQVEFLLADISVKLDLKFPYLLKKRIKAVLRIAERPSYEIYKDELQAYLVAGATTGSSVTFTVNWKGFLVPDCHSTTVWRGRFVGPALKTRWTLDYVGSDGKPHVLRGNDVFTKQ